MFGMLDYRAHKLYWLIILPLKIINALSFYAVIFISILIANQIFYGIFVKIIAAYIIFEGLLLLALLVFWLICSAIKKIFFWLVDVVPAYGANTEEAEVVVLQGGKLFQLTKKFESEIENWTSDDTSSFIRLNSNWRARLFFKPMERLERVVEKLQQIHQETGQEPSALGTRGIETIREGIDCGHITLVEKAIVTQQFFNSIK